MTQLRQERTTRQRGRRYAFLTGVIIAGILALSACGQTGDLRLPDAPSQTPLPAASPEPEQAPQTDITDQPVPTDGPQQRPRD